VGLTHVLKTQFIENLNWIKHGFRDPERPTRIALYDIETRRLVREIDLDRVD
jgi:hypothetical protein